MIWLWRGFFFATHRMLDGNQERAVSGYFQEGSVWHYERVSDVFCLERCDLTSVSYT